MFRSLVISSTFISFSSIASGAFTPTSRAASEAFPFSPGFDIEAVTEKAVSLPSHSWEYGTATEALLELYDAEHSVYGRPFPIPTIQPQDSRSLTYAKEKIVIGTGANALSDGDGAVSDPASLGVGALMLGKTNQTYSAAAKEQADFMLNEAPRWFNGAISHRVSVTELWADFIYMAPPFLAYYGVATNNASVLIEAVNQCLWYREVMRANTTTGEATPPTSHPAIADGLWEHIIGPQSADHGLWSTSNAWATGGMMRVLATVLRAPPGFVSREFKKSAARDLTATIREILDGAMRVPTDGGLLRNYLDDPTWWGEIAGSTLQAAVAYRLITAAPLLAREGVLLRESEISNYVQWAEGIRTVIGTGPHVTAEGIVTPAVNPLWWGDRTPFTTGSPEGNNFAVLMYAAWRDCVLAGVTGCTAPTA